MPVFVIACQLLTLIYISAIKRHNLVDKFVRSLVAITVFLIIDLFCLVQVLLDFTNIIKTLSSRIAAIRPLFVLSQTVNLLWELAVEYV